MKETEIIIADFQKWLNKHKKEIIAAGVSVIAITGFILCIKNKDAFLEFIKVFESKTKCVPTEINTLSVDNVISNHSQNVRAHTTTTISYNVERHIRNLPSGMHHSAEKGLQANVLGIHLLPNQTIVDSYTKGLAA